MNALERDMKRSRGLGRYPVDYSEKKNRKYLGGRRIPILDGQDEGCKKCCLN